MPQGRELARDSCSGDGFLHTEGWKRNTKTQDFSRLFLTLAHGLGSEGKLVKGFKRNLKLAAQSQENQHVWWNKGRG